MFNSAQSEDMSRVLTGKNYNPNRTGGINLSSYVHNIVDQENSFDFSSQGIASGAIKTAHETMPRTSHQN